MKEFEVSNLDPAVAQAIQEMQIEQGDGFSLEKINLAELGRRTGISRHKLRRMKENGFVKTQHGLKGRKAPFTLLTGYTAILDDLLRNGIVNSTVCLKRLQQKGFPGGQTIVKEYISSHQDLVPAKRCQVSPQGSRGRRNTTEPGEAYQMDWGFTKVLDYNGNEYNAACFAMDMAFLSHILIFCTIIVTFVKYIGVARQDGKGSPWLEMAALLMMGGGSVIDLFRTYTIYVGDFGKFSRYGTTAYGLIMVFIHIRRIVRNETEEIEANKRYLEQEVDRKTEQIRNMLGQTINALSNAVDAKDCYTNGHSKRVAEYAKMLAERMGIDRSEQEEIYFAGLLHDIGKIRVPDNIIKKEGRLTDEEFDYIKLHPVSGYHILKGISAFSMIADGAKYHHERYDGKGYPNGLSGDNIPLVAQILCVADAYDAMTSNRCCRNALPQEVVRQEIVKGKGTQFNPEIAELMLEIMDEDSEYRLRQNDSYQRSILVVADESMRETAVACITQESSLYQVLGCTSAKETLEILAQRPIQLVLLDAEMPGMDGLEMLKTIQDGYHIPTVYMTSDKNWEALRQAEALGADDYLVKPFLPLQLNEIVHSILGN